MSIIETIIEANRAGRKVVWPTPPAPARTTDVTLTMDHEILFYGVHVGYWTQTKTWDFVAEPLSNLWPNLRSDSHVHLRSEIVRWWSNMPWPRCTRCNEVEFFLSWNELCNHCEDDMNYKRDRA